MFVVFKAPSGKTRIIGVDPLDRSDYLVGDYDNSREAFLVADNHNIRRNYPADIVYCAYNDKGELVRDERITGVGPGVLPY